MLMDISDNLFYAVLSMDSYSCGYGVCASYKNAPIMG